MRSQHTQLVVYVDYDMRYSRRPLKYDKAEKKVLFVSQMCRVYSLDLRIWLVIFQAETHTHKHARNAARTKPNAKTINFQLFRNEAYSTFCSSH